ncbi:MAG: bi-domain-containing oxidoreductase [Gemmatimonadales bacterium]
MTRQLLQNLKTGELLLQEVPRPSVPARHLLVATRTSLISAGTERMLVEFSRGNLLDKARSQPEKVAQVLDKIATDGLLPTLDAVRSKLGEPLPLGYCNAGVVIQTGPGVEGFAVGDRVATNGPHAEVVRVPQTLAARIPDGVSDEAASFTPLAAIALQGVRLAEPTLGETVVVVGLGLVGLLTVQLARASGCRVIGIDRDPGRLALAGEFGATAVDGTATGVVEAVLGMTGGRGADAVLLTLASKDAEPMHQAAKMSRQRGRVILVGTVGLELSRDEFFKKELRFAVSCSYGPGRYDHRYEDDGIDYPLGFVRWTAQRNFEAVLALMGDRRLDPMPLVSHRFGFDEVRPAYDLIAGGGASLGVLLKYPETDRAAGPGALPSTGLVSRTTAPGTGGLGVIGAGNFTRRTLLPALRRAGAQVAVIGSGQGASAAVAASQFGIPRVVGGGREVLAAKEVGTVFITTRHDAHAAMVLAALAAGKHVFVEKPLALSLDDVDRIETALVESDRLLMVGFNRRFAPLAVEMREALRSRSGPASLVIQVNAGALPREHWTRQPLVGGGRIVGEACHFIDLARFLTGSPIVSLDVTAGRDAGGGRVEDLAHLTLGFADGSVATVAYLPNGSRRFPKEWITASADGRTLVLENWRRLRRFGSGRTPILPAGQDKGHAAEMQAWLAATAAGGPAPIPAEELFEVSRWAIRAEALARGVTEE